MSKARLAAVLAMFAMASPLTAQGNRRANDDVWRQNQRVWSNSRSWPMNGSGCVQAVNGRMVAVPCPNRGRDRDNDGWINSRIRDRDNDSWINSRIRRRENEQRDWDRSWHRGWDNRRDRHDRGRGWHRGRGDDDDDDRDGDRDWR
jgi:hypothetical protein